LLAGPAAVHNGAMTRGAKIYSASWGIAAALLLGGAALAQEDDGLPWVQMDLGGGFAIDIPAILADRAKPADDAPKDVMMAFGLSAGDPGTLSCQLKRVPYSADMPRETLAASLGKGDMGDFCKVQRDGISNLQTGQVVPGQTDGVPSAGCLSAFTDQNQEARGRVLTMDVVAGKKNSYQLICLNAFDDQEGAVTAYATRWSAIITRMQKSLRLAADEK
jgi:hypothetical protein